MASTPAARLIAVTVKPNARISELREDPVHGWQAALRAPPTDGKANAELISLIAAHFGCPKACVSIKRGVSSRRKLVKIEV